MQAEAVLTEGKELLREAIDMARATGLWQELCLEDKKSVVDYFYARYLAEARRSNVTG